MWFLTLVAWLAFFIQAAFLTIGLAAALYYLAELVEEYTVTAGRVIKVLIMFTLFINIGILVLEDLPRSLSVIGIVSQIVHLTLVKSFPTFYPLSPSFLTACGLIAGHHYMAFTYFAETFHEFYEVLAYFTICLWLVPFAFFVSLSANEQTLPTTVPSQNTDSNDLVSNYFSSTSKKSGQSSYSLRGFFQYMRDVIVPSSTKRYS